MAKLFAIINRALDFFITYLSEMLGVKDVDKESTEA